MQDQSHEVDTGTTNVRTPGFGKGGDKGISDIVKERGGDDNPDDPRSPGFGKGGDKGISDIVKEREKK